MKNRKTFIYVVQCRAGREHSARIYWNKKNLPGLIAHIDFDAPPKTVDSREKIITDHLKTHGYISENARAARDYRLKAV